MNHIEHRKPTREDETQELSAVERTELTRSKLPLVQHLTVVERVAIFNPPGEPVISVTLTASQARLLNLFLRAPQQLVSTTEIMLLAHPSGNNLNRDEATKVRIRINLVLKGAKIPAMIVEKSPDQFYLSPIIW